MTTRDRAKEALSNIMGGMYSGDDENYALKHIEQALIEERKAGAEEERAACATIALEEEWEHATHSQGEECAQRIGHKIRARSS